jgi:secreted trypsin-like serine protease
MGSGVGPGAAALRLRRCRLRHYLLAALVLVMVLGVGAAAPAFAAQEQESGQPGEQIVGGTAVPDGKYPFMAALLDVSQGATPLQQQFCGGALIDQSHVLTAAHCMGDPIQSLRVVVGRTVLNSNQGQVRRVSRVFIHPRYDGSKNSAFDAAVLELASPVQGIQPVKLPATGSNKLERPGTKVTIAGWGRTFEGKTTPLRNRMREASLPVVSDAKCEARYNTLADPRLRVFPSIMLCASKTNVDTCQGDSGGPLFRAERGGFRQLGIVSFGFGCARPGFPGVYTQVSAPPIANFIKNVTGGAAAASTAEPDAA